jgi:L-fuconolactonase
MRIDSHQHFWIFNEREFAWIDDNMQIIRKDHLPLHLNDELRNIGFDGSVAVQARQCLEETDWLLQLSDQHDTIKGVIGWVDLQSSQVEEQLIKYTKHQKMVGVRHVIHDEPDDDFMLGNNFLRGIRYLEKFNLTYDVLVFPKHLPNTIRFVEQFPKQLFVLDHMAKPFIKNKTVSPWKENIEHLAKFSNVYCKLSGMVTEADWRNWTKGDFKPYLDTVFSAFGTDRIMIGSDWPVCKVAGEYKQIMDIVMEYIQLFSNQDKNKILGENAIKAYHLKI